MSKFSDWVRATFPDAATAAAPVGPNPGGQKLS